MKVSKSIFIYLFPVSVLALTFLFASGAIADPPDLPHHSLPADNATGVERSIILEWFCDDPDGDELTYDIYFGTSNNPPLVESGWPGSFYNPFEEIGSVLEANTTYYWKIIVEDTNGETTTGATWSFTTMYQIPLQRWLEHTLIENLPDVSNLHNTDLDGDGDQDILFIQNEENIAGWLGNDGNLNFTYHMIDDNFIHASSISSADLDLDGDMDILVTCSGSGELIWLENDGNQDFTPHVIDNTYGDASDMIATDIDCDGDLDLISTGIEYEDVSWWENDGSQNFSEHIIDTFFSGSYAVKTGDMDNDGDIDVVAAAYYDNQITWFRNTGNQFIVSLTISMSFNGANSLDLADIDCDGDLDIVATAGIENSVIWWENDESSFSYHIIEQDFLNANSIQAIDIEGDGDIDILGTAGDADLVKLWVNDGNATFDSRTIESGFDGASSVFAANLNNDNDLEIIASAEDAGLILCWENVLNQPPVTPELIYPDNLSNQIPSLVSFNWSCSDPENDEITYDLLLSTTNPPETLIDENIPDESYQLDEALENQVTYYWQVIATDEYGESTASEIWSFTTLPNQPPVMPFGENPSNNTTAVNCNTALRWSCSDPDGEDINYDIYFGISDPPPLVESDWTENIYSPFEQTGIPLDFNTTYYWNIVAEDESGNLSTSDTWNFSTLGASDTYSWHKRLITNNINTPIMLDSEDIDSDGDQDIVAVSYNNNYISWYENDGFEEFIEHIIYLSYNSPRAVLAKDINGDNYTDIVVASDLSSRIDLFVNNGFQEFTNHIIALDIAAATSIDAADLDNDGDVDIVGAARGGQNVIWFMNTGDMDNFETIDIPDNIDGARFVQTVDMENDGDIDILCAAINGNTVSWYENDGIQNFDEHIITNSLNGANCVRSIDMDNDGDLDIVASGVSSENPVWYENDGMQNFTFHIIPLTITQINFIDVADINGDGFEDIMGTSFSDDEVYWIQNDNTVFSKHTLDDEFHNPSAIIASDLDSDNDNDIIAIAYSAYELSWWEFGVNSLPDLPQVLSPPDGSIEVSTFPYLNWSCFDPDDDDITYTLLFSASTPPDEVLVSDYEENFWNVNTQLEYNSTYYWQVIVTDEWGATVEGNIWSFSTAETNPPPNSPSSPIPQDQAENVARTIDLTWLGGDPEFEQTSYDIYFGTENPPPLALSDWTGNFFNTSAYLGSPLAENTVYYWQIVNHDETSSSSGEIWSFTTISEYVNEYQSPIIIADSFSGACSVKSADLDLDGDTDIIGAAFADDQLTIWINNGNQSFTQQNIQENLNTIRDVVICDFNNDSLPDIIVCLLEGNSIYWFENLDNLQFQPHIISEGVEDAYDIDVADINDDGYEDIICAGQNNIICWIENFRYQQFYQHIISTGYNNVSSVIAEDINSDGFYDILGSANSQGAVIIWYGNSDYTFEEHIVDNTFAGSNSIRVADLDNDGDKDFLACSEDYGQIAYWIQDENGEFDKTVLVENFTNVFVIDVCDLDGDGDIDIIGGTTPGGEFHRWENLGNLNFVEYQLENNLAAVRDVCTVNLDGDNDIDILATGGNRISWWECNGAGNLPPGEFFIISPLDGEHVNNDTVTVSWEPSTDPNGHYIQYVIDWTTDENFETFFSDVTNETSYEITDIEETLASGEDLEFNPTSITNSSITLKPSKPTKEKSGKTTYSIKGPTRNKNQKEELNLISATNNSFTLKNESDIGKIAQTDELDELPDNITVYWRVKAVDIRGAYTWANNTDEGFSFNVDIFDPPLPFDLLSPGLNDTCWTLDTVLTWQATTDPDPESTVLYEVWFDTLEDMSTAWIMGEELSETSLELTDLPDDRAFYWDVLATDENTPGTWSNYTSLFYTYYPEPLETFELAFPENSSTVNSDTVTVSWYKPSDPDPNDPATYTVQWSIEADFSVPFSAETQDTFFIITDLEDLQASSNNHSGGKTVNSKFLNKKESSLNPSTCGLDELPDDNTIYWRVTASDNFGFNADCIGYEDGWSFFIDEYQPPVVFPLVSPVNGDTSWDLNATLAWNSTLDPDPYDIPFYDVWMDTIADFSTAILIADSLMDTTLSLEQLPDDKNYFWTVHATDSNTQGTWSQDTLNFYTYLPEAPGAFELIEPQDGSIIEEVSGMPVIFRWQGGTDPDPNDMVNYSIEISSDDEFTAPLILGGIQADSIVIDALPINHYWWRIKAADSFNYITYSENVWTLNVTLGIEEKFSGMPTQYEIASAFPNPFNPSLAVIIALPENAYLSLKIFNLMGREIATLTQENYNAGYHKFVYDGSTQASGVYFIKATVPGKLNQMQKVVLVK